MLRVRVRVRVSVRVKIKVRVSSSILPYCRSTSPVRSLHFTRCRRRSWVPVCYSGDDISWAVPLAFSYEMNVTNIALRCLCIITTLEIFMNNAVFLLILQLCRHFSLFIYISA